MGWVLLGVALLYGMANLSLLYSLLRVHRWRDVAQLWGYAPNQFLFLVVVFPFATLYTFLALRVLVVRVRTSIPLTDPSRFVLEHWSAWLVLGLAFVCVMAVVVYFSSAMSLDKLRPTYARIALEAIGRFEDTCAKFPENKRGEWRENAIQAARQATAALQPPSGEEEEKLAAWLRQQPPEVALQYLISPNAQLRLRLLEPTVHALNVFQLVVGLFVGATALATALLTIHAARAIAFPGTANPDLSEVIRSLGLALFFFALYPLLYHQLRVQLQEFVGSGFSVLQDVFAAGLVLIVLFMLNAVEPSEKLLSLATAAKYLPIAVITSGFAANGLSPTLLRQIIGRDTTWGVQAILSLVFIGLASLPLISQLAGRK